MNKSLFLPLSAALLVVSLGLVGCGNKGPLKAPSPSNTATTVHTN